MDASFHVSPNDWCLDKDLQDIVVIIISAYWKALKHSGNKH